MISPCPLDMLSGEEVNLQRHRGLIWMDSSFKAKDRPGQESQGTTMMLGQNWVAEGEMDPR